MRKAKKIPKARQRELELIEQGKLRLAEQKMPNPLFHLARTIRDERRRRFVAALSAVLSRLTADEMDKIEVHLRDAAGRIWFKDILDNTPCTAE